MSAISGTSTIAERPAASAACDRAAGRPRSCPSRSRRAADSRDGRARGRASAARIGASAAACSSVSAGAAAEALPTAWRAGRRGRGRRSIATRPRPSRRRRPGVPSSAATVGPRSGERLQQLALAVGEPGALVGQRGTPGGGQLGDQRPLGPRAGRGPGASMSPSARAGVEQYSRAIQSASSTRSAGPTPAPSTASGSDEPVGVELGALGELHHHPERAAGPERHAQQRSDLARPGPGPGGSRTARAPRGSG